MERHIQITTFALILATISETNGCDRRPPPQHEGVATFTTPYDGQVFFVPTGDMIKLTGHVTGLPPGRTLGVHIHEMGNVGNNCSDAGGHYNPKNKTHGGLTGPNRHLGDLGNIQTDSSGRMLFDLSVEAPRHGWIHDFIGLTLVIHSGQDDLGVNPDQGSKTTGNSGFRLACATIGFRHRTY
ncbi:unnamed protein product [Calicophoron daubneyi]|uniref:Superoxide dismutase [Cu-Zn] n=1 Tax=Calicophoron daubneyi TaxID=300641 RepID=A0AAV2TNF8_CALDB